MAEKHFNSVSTAATVIVGSKNPKKQFYTKNACAEKMCCLERCDAIGIAHNLSDPTSVLLRVVGRQSHMEKPPFVVSWIFRSVMSMNRIQANLIPT